MRYPVLEPHQRKATLRFMVIDHAGRYSIHIQDRRRRFNLCRLLKQGWLRPDANGRGTAKRWKCAVIFRVKAMKKVRQ